MDEDQLYIRESPYKPRRVLETASIESLATYLEQLPTRQDVWRAALLGVLTGERRIFTGKAGYATTVLSDR